MYEKKEANMKNSSNPKLDEYTNVKGAVLK
jgi:hypothetical protein